MTHLHPLLALGVLISTAATDAVYVMFNAAVSSRRRIPAATWSSVWYLLSAFAVISFTRQWIYVIFAATGSWIGAYLSMTFLGRSTKTRLQTGDGIKGGL
jgi:predicted small integral membrane protein